MTKASDLFIECLEEEGCEYIFGIPGEENLDFLDSLSRSKKIKLVLTRHEQGAGFMASVYGRLTGKTGVCLSTLGPGATNFTTAAAYAQLGGMPMLMITGQKPVKSSKQGRFQILDVVDMMGPITKYATQIVAGDNIPSRVREAFRIAEEDLRLRGAGEMLGTRQSGLPVYKVADITKHQELMMAARDDARLIIERDPALTSERGKALRILLYLFAKDSVVQTLRSG